MLYRFSEARSNMSRLVDQVLAGSIALIERRGVRVMVTAVDDQEQILSSCFAFDPQVHFADGQVEIWLPGLDLHSEGQTLEEAETDLVGAVEQFVHDWESHLRHAPNQANKLGWVQRVQIAQASSRLRQLIFDQ